MPGICEPSSGWQPTIDQGGILLLEEPPRAHDRSGRAHARHEMRDASAGLVPDLGPGASIVRKRIVRIAELIEDDAASLVAHPLGDVARRLHPAGLGRENDFGAERGHRLPPLQRQVLGHDENHLVPAQRGRHRERDAGVAAGRLDQSVAALDVSALLGLDDHRQGGPVLDRARGIVALELGEQHVARVADQSAEAAPAACCRRYLRWFCTWEPGT